MNSLIALAHMSMAAVATYVLHSTVLLVGCWVAIAWLRLKSKHLIERMWKWAAVFGLLTTSVQFGIGAHVIWTVDTYAGHTPQRQTVLGTEPFELPQTMAAPNPIDANWELHWPADDRLASAVQEHTSAGAGRRDRPVESLASDRDGIRGQLGSSQPIDDSSVTASLWSPAVVVVVVAASALAVMSIGASLLVWESGCLWWQFSSACEIRQGPGRRLLNRLLRRNGVRRPIRLLESHRVVEPVAFGLLHWTIALPPGIHERLKNDELNAVLAHELAHLVRRDVVWLWIGRILCACLPFQPLNFLACRRWQRAAEYLCDEWAVEHGGSAMSLARCLTTIAQWRNDLPCCAAGLSAAGSRHTLVQRVKHLLDRRQAADPWQSTSHRLLTHVGGALCMVTLIVCGPQIILPATHGDSMLHGQQPPQTSHRDALRATWNSLDNDLRRLQSDLQQTHFLLDRLPSNAAAQSLLDKIDRHAAALQSRRSRISASFRKESK